MVAVYSFANGGTGIVPGAPFTFLGLPKQVTLTSTQRITATTTATFNNMFLDGGTVAVPDVSVALSICYSAPGNLPATAVQLTDGVLHEGEASMSVSASFVPGAGDWLIGACAITFGPFGSPPNTTLGEAALVGWFMVTNE